MSMAGKVLPHAEKKLEFMESAPEISQVTILFFSRGILKELRSSIWLTLARSLLKVPSVQPNGSAGKKQEFIPWTMCLVYKNIFSQQFKEILNNWLSPEFPYQAYSLLT